MIVDRARACLGSRFRLHGRDPTTGLDCVGLAAFALGIENAPNGYAMRGGTVRRIAAMIEAAGLVATDEARAGDVLLCASGPGQWHLAVATGNGIIHACAMLRRVVERTGAPPWPVTARWRKAGDCTRTRAGGTTWQR